MTQPEQSVPQPSADNITALQDEIARRALDLGFAVVGFTAPDSIPHAEQGMARFVSLGRQGDMDWLARDVEKRAAPSKLWDETKSIIVLGMRYTPDMDPMDRLARKRSGVISVYALGKDYHDVIKKRLKQIGRWLAETHKCGIKVFVDTAPVMEKPLAEAAGIGWQGKHTNLVSPTEGSWLFLGSIFTTLDLTSSLPHRNQCGTCQKCLDICPTNAFPSPYQLDARRCISYLTIEHKGHIPREFRTPMGNRIYGCDDCLAVCPWNKFAQDAAEIALQPRSNIVDPPLQDLVALDDAQFRQLFAGSPVKRTGRNRFVRNVLIAIGNSGDTSLAKSAEQRLQDESPLVRAMAVWALSQLLPPEKLIDLKSRFLQTETDEDVRAEWNAV